MKNVSYIFILVLLSTAAVNSCKKPTDFVVNDSVVSGGHLPVSSNALVDVADNTALNGHKYAAGTSFKTELQFFSIDPIQEIDLYATIGTGARKKVMTYPYMAAYSPIKKLDTLLVPYTLSDTLSVNTAVKLEYEILNVDTLNIIRAATITVK